MNLRSLNTLAALAVGAMISTTAQAETLSDALVSTYRNSGLIDQNRAVLRAADEDVAQAIAELRPVLKYLASVEYADTSQSAGSSAKLGLSADMLLYDFGRSQLSIDIAKETVLATRAALIDAENTALFNAVNAFQAVRRSVVFVELRENNVRLLIEQLRATRDRFEVGEVTRTDVSLSEASLAAARSSLAAERGGLARAKEQYRTIVGDYPGTLAPAPGMPSIPATEGEARAIARQENPIAKQVQHQVKAAELGVQIASRAMRPSLNANGRLSVNDDGDESASIGLELSGRIYQGGAISSQLRQAQARRDEARSQLYTAGLQVDQQVGNAYANLAVAIASIDASRQQVSAAELALRGTREELQLGARTTLDVLDQEQEVLDARTNLVSAEVDRIVAAYQVLDSIGLMTAENLRLNVPIYDPAAYYNAVSNAPRGQVSKQGQALDRVLRSIGKQ
ncbi:TolC family outer membrane protein [uncultured Boseongicola sp.]|uniref:TolC family outer membrane protein n=1 Tax=uncultured Boseongicola sp. TaxID=1648499 RepID=UPI0026376212|nr:TolC family outer membrane protein [uncultured Boseongicola sp.]